MFHGSDCSRGNSRGPWSTMIFIIHNTLILDYDVITRPRSPVIIYNW